MNFVVERCPNCGVEHDTSHAGPCEVCGHGLRYWCQRHSRDTGWLSGPECALCQRESEAARPPPRATPPPLERDPAADPRPERSDPVERRPPTRVRAEDVLPHVATGAGLALRMVAAVLALVRTVLLWAFLGAVVGAGYGMMVGGELAWLTVFGLVNGAAVGFFLGLVRFFVLLFRSGHRR